MMKRIILAFLMSVVALALVGCGGYTPDNHWVLEKDRVSEDPEIENFVSYLQRTPDNKGFKVFTIAEGRKMVVVSTGNEAKSLKLDEVKAESGNTNVIVKEVENQNDEDNPYIMIGISAIHERLCTI